MRFPHLVALAVIVALTGCHSAFVEATVSNRTAQIVSLVEVDYPSASFGTQNLAPGADFHYRFKVLGSGPVKVIYTDSSHREQQATGPILDEGMEGPMQILFTSAGIQWKAPPAKR